MNESLRDLLMFIIRSGKFITVKDISKAYGISTRTVYNDLNAINQFLMDIKMKPLEKVKGMGVRYLLSRKEETALLKLLNDGDYVYLSSNERKYKVIITLLENDNYFTIDNLADLLQVSRNTAINDVSNARLWIEDFNLRLETFPFKGIFISGEEADIRRVLFKICFERERNLGYEDRVLYDILSEKEIKLLEGIIDVVENRLKLSFSDVSYSNIKLSFCIAIQRMKRKHYVSSYIESSKVEITKEYSVLYKMRNDITRLFNIEIPEEEIVYLSNQIISSCVQHLEITNFIFENWVHIQIVLRDFISAVEMELGVALKQDDKLFQGLQIHLRPAFYRLLNGTSIDNPILQQIKEQFGYIHKAVIRNLYILENNFNVTFTESEASFITMYFSGAVERLKKEPKKVLSVAIVCNSGISTSQMLLAQLKSRFEINIVGTFSARNIDSISCGLQIGLWITVMNMGIRMLLAELVPAFHGVAEKLIPNAMPGLDIPVLFPNHSNCIILGFVVCLISGLVGMVILSTVGYPVVVFPILIQTFFCGASAAIFGNSTGGVRGAVIGAWLAGVVLIFGQAFLLPCIGTFAPVIRVLGDADYCFYGPILGNLLKVLGGI